MSPVGDALDLLEVFVHPPPSSVASGKPIRVAVPELDSCGEDKGGRYLVLGIGEYTPVTLLALMVLVRLSAMSPPERLDIHAARHHFATGTERAPNSTFIPGYH